MTPSTGRQASERVDREQVRRDASGWFGDVYRGKLARHCLALLAELEQAERERDEARADARGNAQGNLRLAKERRELEARLAAVPALVEALEQIANCEIDPELCPARAWDALDGYRQSKQSAGAPVAAGDESVADADSPAPAQKATG